MKVGKIFILIAAQFFLFISITAQPQWELTGELYGGDIRNIAKSPNGTLYAGLQNGSLYKKKSGNDSWELLVEGSYPYDYNSFPGLLTVDDSLIITSSKDRGTERSTDAGNTWQHLNLGNGSISINDSGHIFHLSHSNCCDLSMSTDGGETWQIYPLNCKAMDFGEVGFTKNDSLWIIGSKIGILISSDQGITWEERNNGIYYEAEVYSVYIDSLDNIYIGTNLTVYYSSNYGHSWTEKDSGLPSWSSVRNFVALDNTTIFAATRKGIYFTTNAGISWNSYNPNIENLEIHKLIQDKGSFLLATSESLFKVHSQTHNFFDKGISDIKVSKFYKYKDKIYAATNRGLFYSDDNGTNWHFPEGTRKLKVTDITASDSILFFVRWKTLYYSLDGISNWITKSFMPVCISLVAANYTLYGGMFEESNWYDLHYSRNFGTSWTPKPYLDLHLAKIYYLNRDPHENIYFLGYSMWEYVNYIFLSTDDGNTFTEFNQGFSPQTDFWPYSIASDPNNNLYLSTSEGIYFRGASDTIWTFRGLYGKNIVASAVDSAGILYTVADNQIYYSDNLGFSYTPFNDGLPVSGVSSIFYCNSSKSLFVGANEGVFKRSRPNITSVKSIEQEMPQQFNISSYPNPFNSSAVISFSLPERSFTKISLYNSIGEKVKDLLKIEKEAGNHQLTFDAADLPSGIYFCRMDSEKFTQTIKLVLVK